MLYLQHHQNRGSFTSLLTGLAPSFGGLYCALHSAITRRTCALAVSRLGALLRVSLSHVNGPSQHHSDAIITVGHVTSTLKQPFPIACYIVMDTQMSAMERDAIDQQSIYIHCGYTHLVADITLCFHIFRLTRLHSSSCRGLSILVFLHFHKLLQHNIP